MMIYGPHKLIFADIRDHSVSIFGKTFPLDREQGILYYSRTTILKAFAIDPQIIHYGGQDFMVSMIWLYPDRSFHGFNIYGYSDYEYQSMVYPVRGIFFYKNSLPESFSVEKKAKTNFFISYPGGLQIPIKRKKMYNRFYNLSRAHPVITRNTLSVF